MLRSSSQTTPWRKTEIERKPSGFGKLTDTQQPEAMSRRTRTRREETEARFTLGVRAKVHNPNPAFLLVQKLKSATKGFTLGVKSEIEKNFSICPK
jgi:hypothetical protein